MSFNRKSLFTTVSLTLSALIPLQINSAYAQEALQTAYSKEPAMVAVSHEPMSDSPASTDDKFQVQNEQGATQIDVRKSWDTGFASVYINNREILKFRAPHAGLSPYDRARQAAKKLHEFLEAAGQARDIKPGLQDKQVVVRAGSNVFAVVDAKTAQSASQSSKALAIAWANNLRTALGADAINRGQIASRSLSGASRELLQEEGASSAELPNHRSSGVIRSGLASWYGPGFHGRRAANGSRFDMYGLTAAHRSLPFGTPVRVKNQRTGQSCIVKITDRGPFIGNRIIDLSRGAAAAIGMLGSGVARVTLEILQPAQ